MACPHCGKVNDCHTAADKSDATPQDGDTAICIGCGNWSVFEHESLRFPTAPEWDAILDDPECMKVERAWKRMNAERRAKTL